MLEQLPADAGALTVLAAALAWALSELRAHRKHKAEIDRERIDLQREHVGLERQRTEAVQRAAEDSRRRTDEVRRQADAQEEIADQLDGPTPPPPLEGRSG